MEFVDALVAYGPWAVTACCFYAIRRMYSDMKSFNGVMIELLKDSTKVIQSNTDALQEMRDVIDWCKDGGNNGNPGSAVPDHKHPPGRGGAPQGAGPGAG